VAVFCLVRRREFTVSVEYVILGGGPMNFEPMAGVNKIANDSWKKQQDMFSQIAKRNNEKEQREIELLQSVKEIKDFIPEIMSLVRQNNQVNKELFALYQEMNTIMIANSKEEAENIFFTVITKLKDTKDGIDAATGLFTYGKALIMKAFGIEE
jgi:hypothetical protein